MKKNILVIGPSSEIADDLISRIFKKFNIYSLSRKKINNKKIFKDINIDFLSNNFKKLKNNFNNIKFSYVIFFISDQAKFKRSLLDISNKKILNILYINSIFSIKLTYFLIKNNFISKNSNIIFFSSKAGSISDRGKKKHHKKSGNHLYRASKSLLNSFVKNLSFQYSSKSYRFICYEPGWVNTKSAKGKIPVKLASRRFSVFMKKILKKHSGKFLNYKFVEIPW